MKILRAFLTIFVFATSSALAVQTPSAPQRVSRDVYEQWMQRLTNSGRWGPGDQLGTLNFITPTSRLAAAQLVRDGVSISLAHDLVPGPTPNAIAPLKLRYFLYPADSVVTWSLDEVTLLAHGWAYTHLDALSHSIFRGFMYNENPEDHSSERGAAELGVETFRDGIVGRAVLVDLPLLFKRPFLEPGTAVTAADIEAWEKHIGIRITEGDIVLIRTGRGARVEARGDWKLTEGTAGPHPSLALWLSERRVAVLGSDVSNELYPSTVPGIADPLHHLALRAMGLPLLDNLNLEVVAAESAKRSRWAFLFVVAPLRIMGGSGSAINPLAIF